MTHFEIPPDSLSQIAGSVLEAMFALPFVPVNAGAPQPSVTASVRIRGTWEGVICVEAAPALAADLARLLLALEEPPSPSDTRDALAEITNTIAGNYKSAFAPGARLALPCIGNPAEGLHPSESVSYDCQGRKLRITRYAS